jgi:hypothetical protein
LSFADRHRLVGIGIVPEFERDKLVAPYGGHRFENSRRGNAALANLRFDHHAPLGRRWIEEEFSVTHASL